MNTWKLPEKKPVIDWALVFKERRGRMIDDEWAWCSCCGETQVHAAGGYDTCRSCATKL